MNNATEAKAKAPTIPAADIEQACRKDYENRYMKVRPGLGYLGYEDYRDIWNSAVQFADAGALSAPQVDSLRILPHSIEAEQSVIGSLLRDNAALDHIADLMNADDFYRYDHRIIYEQIVRLINSSKPANVLTVFESLSMMGKQDEMGGIAYLSAIAQNTPSVADIRRYADIVRKRSTLRELITVADEISGQAFSPQGKEVKQMLDEAESKISAIAAPRADAMRALLLDAQAALAANAPPNGVSAHDTIAKLMDLLDGPRSRAVLGQGRAAPEVTK